MKKTISILLLVLSVFAFNNCSDEIVGGTKDINYVSFEGASATMTVEKNSNLSREFKIYTTQTTGEDRVFTIKVITASTTAVAAAYTIPTTVTVPANTNVGAFTVRISDVSIAASGTKVVLGFENQEGLFIGSNMTINMLRLCTFNINDFIGAYIINEAGYGEYATTITKHATVVNRIWITNFWDWTNELVYFDFNPTNGAVTVPSQMILMGDGKRYNVVGSGTYNACAGTFRVTYQGDVAGTIHDFRPGTLGLN